jgi:hypothetical protein
LTHAGLAALVGLSLTWDVWNMVEKALVLFH